MLTIIATYSTTVVEHPSLFLARLVISFHFWSERGGGDDDGVAIGVGSWPRRRVPGTATVHWRQ
jgi:hypothetical protein